MEKKRHHYVPITYLNGFTDNLGRIFGYRKDAPNPPLHVRPDEIGFEKYYYSQPTPDGGQDNNRLEDLFSTVEGIWPGIVADLSAGRQVGSRIEELFQFISLLRIRGPAARDPIELYLAHHARRTMLQLAAEGKIGPLPGGLTFDDIEISIDPHQSLHGMIAMMGGFARLLGYFGIEVMHNTTAEPFATSDNPVVVFDPDVPEAGILPYTVRSPIGRVEMLLPISSKTMLRGRSGIAPHRAGDTLRHVEMSAGAEVRRVNRFVARFGYRFVFASHAGLGKLVEKHAALSPTVRFDEVDAGVHGQYEFMQMVFGPRPQKPKWTRDRKRPINGEG